MKLLLHICCAPCSIVPVRELRAEGEEITGFFFRDNIHPYTECRRREETLRAYAPEIGLEVVYPSGYDLEGFIRKLVFREDQRCRICFHERLSAAAALAKERRYEAFSTTLLYSRYQPHDVLREIGEAVGRSAGLPFLYRDFRAGWQAGVSESRRLGMYRQK